MTLVFKGSFQQLFKRLHTNTIFKGTENMSTKQSRQDQTSIVTCG